MSTPRLDPILPEDRTEYQQQLMDAAGRDFRVFSTLVRHPDLFGAYLPLGTRLLARSLLTPREREILILRAAYGIRAEYEWGHHAKIAATSGVEDDVIAEIGTPQPQLAAEDALLIRAADELVDDHRLSQQTWDTLSQRFGDMQLIEICMLVGAYAMLGATLNSLQVQLEDGYPTAPWLSDPDERGV
ncbi:carboxymuconolactone decarboxylase family protein [Epidermidibacterium keratini]|uniref:Carboxymuconolactone decarboxylase family protein n=1 Tax=Epidermidibacterium keratini TaxID=1891644 RepID=A0A7L4YNW8_9ACTN|nr:carboxymuconolactone decarboxylase family protein [Epidermidibacterium keratini]QHC00971.1 carboxymuconolactone decarboxylase family protein [Epidermidibacterium keratini]